MIEKQVGTLTTNPFKYSSDNSKSWKSSLEKKSCTREVCTKFFPPNFHTSRPGGLRSVKSASEVATRNGSWDYTLLSVMRSLENLDGRSLTGTHNSQIRGLPQQDPANVPVRCLHWLMFQWSLSVDVSMVFELLKWSYDRREGTALGSYRAKTPTNKNPLSQAPTNGQQCWFGYVGFKHVKTNQSAASKHSKPNSSFIIHNYLTTYLNQTIYSNSFKLFTRFVALLAFSKPQSINRCPASLRS